MTDSPVHVEAEPTRIVVDPQDALPESQWLYRRLIIFGTTLLFSVMLGVIIWQVAQLGTQNPLSAINALTYIAYGVIGLLFLNITLYLIAPSAEQFANWVQKVAALKNGITFKTVTTAEAPQARVKTESASGYAARAASVLESLPDERAAAQASRPEGLDAERPPWER